MFVLVIKGRNQTSRKIVPPSLIRHYCVRPQYQIAPIYAKLSCCSLRFDLDYLEGDDVRIFFSRRRSCKMEYRPQIYDLGFILLTPFQIYQYMKRTRNKQGEEKWITRNLASSSSQRAPTAYEWTVNSRLDILDDRKYIRHDNGKFRCFRRIGTLAHRKNWFLLCDTLRLLGT